MAIRDDFNSTLEHHEFVSDTETAENMTKTILGVITSSLGEQRAEELTGALPNYLNYETLRSHQVSQNSAVPATAIQELKNNFDVAEGQARRILADTLTVLKGEASGLVSEIIQELPDEWSECFDQPESLLESEEAG